MTRNKIFMKIIFICMVMVLCLVCCMTEVKAALPLDGSDADIINEYNRDKDAAEEEIASLTKEEAQRLRDRMDAYLKAYNNNPSQSNTQEAMAAAEKISNLATDRLREINGALENGNINEDDMEDWSFDQIKEWINENDPDAAGLSTDLREKWKETIDNADISDSTKEDYKRRVDGESISEQNNDDIDDARGTSDSPIYNYPSKIGTNDNAEESLDDLITDGNRFLSTGTLNIDQNALQNFSGTMFNILLAVGVVVAVIVGAVIGIKLMTSSVEEQADAKKLLVPYVVGCIVVFGAFGIWKLVVTILQGI